MIDTLKGFRRRLALLCRGNAEEMAAWLAERDSGWLSCCCVIILIGCGLYGATLGLWRDPMQSFYTAIKFPLLIFLTLLANGALNGMLAQALGMGLSFRQTTLAILMNFTIFAMVLGSLTPVALFIVWNTPPLASSSSLGAHHFTKLAHVFAIAYAGVMANLRLYQFLTKLSGNRDRSRKTLFVWLAGNLFLGSQVSWILRPFIGSPYLEVQFLRPNAFDGNFYENIFQTIKQLLS
ncbi:MAG: hypothetical protein HY360_09195 [Verrucomicrobia bacterium]|nr:hypothetical protein [Verrucomicrobiota bacterium]